MAQDAAGRAPEAIASYRKLLLLDPPDPPLVHYQLARLLLAARDPEAKRQALEALEDTPRYRDAQRLLLQIHEAETRGGQP